MLDFRKTFFITSSANIRQMPADQGVEIAFAGRSNSGKSSAINAICDHRGLAKTSSTPGRTQLINQFEVAPGKRLIDLPGYGFAKVPEKVKRDWQKSMSEYLQQRQSLQGLVVTMDIRHPLKDLDRKVLDWAAAVRLRVLVLLTKADKIGTTAREKAVRETQEQLREYSDHFTALPFSALRGLNIDAARALLDRWYTDLADQGDEAPAGPGEEGK
ncbi:MAG: ribosome biogenesis GTP-binding protein YihA/YsxC [Succinivibrionaceae bacterium]|nr:ribosome biogenesis GTP-binding protein YihA/YsxC [Succinivibrionaceae bacterium]